MSTLPLWVQVLNFAAGITELGIVWLVQSTIILAAGLTAGWFIAARAGTSVGAVPHNLGRRRSLPDRCVVAFVDRYSSRPIPSSTQRGRN